MSKLKKYELAAIVRGKLKQYCKLNNITINNFLNIAGISPVKWSRLMRGNDIRFSAIINIVRQTNGFFTFEELAAVVDDPVLPDWMSKNTPKVIEKVIEKKLQVAEIQKQFGKDPLDIV